MPEEFSALLLQLAQGARTVARDLEAWGKVALTGRPAPACQAGVESLIWNRLHSSKTIAYPGMYDVVTVGDRGTPTA